MDIFRVGCHLLYTTQKRGWPLFRAEMMRLSRENTYIDTTVRSGVTGP